MFASKPPSPEPLREYMECRHGDVPNGSPADCVMCTPRWVEHPHVQHNPPNPVLVECRENVEHGLPPELWLAVCRRDSWASMEATDAHIEHARRVLIRLALLGEVS
jgi:hypothetical protein